MGSSTRETHQFMAATALVTCHIFDSKADNYAVQLSGVHKPDWIVDELLWKRTGNRMADEACKRGRLHWAVYKRMSCDGSSHRHSSSAMRQRNKSKEGEKDGW